MLTIKEALEFASKGYYICCNRGNLSYIGYEGLGQKSFEKAGI